MNVLITNKNIILSVLLFGLLVNLLVIFNINPFYLRTIFSYAFLTIIPGLLVMLLLRIKKIDFWEYLINTIGLSTAFLILVGLAINWILPWSHISNEPLSLNPLLIIINSILIVFGIIAYTRNKSLDIYIYLPLLDRINTSLLIIPVTFPVLSILGAMTLNNGGSNYLTMIMLGGIACYVFLTVLLRDKLNELVLPWGIYTISLSVIFMISFRGALLFGSDIQTEYIVYHLTSIFKYWQPNNLPGDLYNLCLSVTILPTIISKITDIDGIIIFKLLLPLLFSFIPVGIYSLVKIYFGKTKSFLSSLFFLSLSSYFNVFATHERQGISTFFFILTIIVLFSKIFTHKIKNIFILIFGLSMILSHYSTAFIALTILTSLYFVMLLIKTFTANKDWRIKNILPSEPKVNLLILVLFWIIFFSWYTQPNKNKTNYFISYLNITINNLKYSFSDYMKADRGSILQELNIFYRPQPQKILDETFQSLTNSQSNNGSNPDRSFNSYKITYLPPSTNTYRVSPEFAISVTYLGEIIKRIGLVFILFGIYYFVFIANKKREASLTFVSSMIICIIIITSSLIIPFVSIGYDIVRIYQQCLIFLSIPAVIGIYYTLQKINNKFKSILLGAFFSIHFLVFTGYIYQLIGGTVTSIQFNNNGYDYDLNFVHLQELNSITWLSNNVKKVPIYIDSSNYKKFGLIDINMNVFYTSLMIPSLIEKHDYVYLGYINSKEDKSIAWLNSISIGYNTPTQYLDQNKNLVYNNGGSKVFK